MIKSLLLAAAGVLLVSAPALACTDVASKVVKLAGCVDDQWQAQKVQGAQEFSYLTADQNFALQVITETAVLPASTMHDAILSNAQAAVNGNKDGVKVVAEHVETIDGKPFNVLEYTVSDGTNTLTYQDVYYSQPGYGTVQILVLSAPADATAAAFKGGQFAATVKLE